MGLSVYRNTAVKPVVLSYCHPMDKRTTSITANNCHAGSDDKPDALHLWQAVSPCKTGIVMNPPILFPLWPPCAQWEKILFLAPGRRDAEKEQTTGDFRGWGKPLHHSNFTLPAVGVGIGIENQRSSLAKSRSHKGGEMKTSRLIPDQYSFKSFRISFASELTVCKVLPIFADKVMLCTGTILQTGCAGSWRMRKTHSRLTSTRSWG